MKKEVRRLFPIAFICSSLALAGCNKCTTSSTPDADPHPPKTLRGAMDLYYEIQTSPTSTRGTGDAPIKVSAIHFYETYIVVEESGSGGLVLPIAKIKELRWHGGPRSGSASEAASSE